jgi:hypothetical protein
LSYVVKDTLGEATRPGGAFDTGGSVPLRDVVIAPATMEVTPAERAARDAYSAELNVQADAITDPENQPHDA